MLRALTLLLSLLPAAPLAGQQPDAPPKATITGTCTGLDQAVDSPARVSLWLHDYRSEGAQLVADTRADVGGTFTFPEVPWLHGHDWGYSFYVLVARQGDRVALLQLRKDDAAAQPLQLALGKGVAVHGTVKDAAGHALSGARVHLAGVTREIAGEQFGERVFFAEPMPPWLATSTGDGSFTLAGLPPGWNYELRCEHPGHVRARLEQPHDESFDFELPRAATLHGKVMLETGGPAARVKVCAQSVGGSTYTFATARTDENGRYALDTLPEGYYNIWAQAENLTVVALAGQQATEAQTDELADLVLVSGQRITGVVVDADTGEPVQPGASGDVAMYGPARPRTGGGCEVARIGSDGKFALRAPPGKVHIYLRSSHAGWNSVGPSAYDLVIEAGTDQEVVFKVRRGRGGKKE
ncbi:MAG: carboxypeptidase regulatory-like domain-containing protein [Planctomycetes bacterium]|nr:carboxypeptidase regulatory-like domain-containing protein [Planctomycetota bacterium]